MVPEGEKHWGGPVVIGGDNLPSLVRIGLSDLQNIGGGPVAPLAPPGPAPLHSIIEITTRIFVPGKSIEGFIA